MLNSIKLLSRFKSHISTCVLCMKCEIVISLSGIHNNTIAGGFDFNMPNHGDKKTRKTKTCVLSLDKTSLNHN